MRSRFLVVVAVLACAHVPRAQCTQVSGVIERDGKPYAFQWDGKELVVRQGEREVARTAPGLLPGTGSAALPIADENGDTMATLNLLESEVLSLQVTPRARTRASLDISVEAPAEALAEHLAVGADEVLVVSRVDDGGAAARAGVRRFDVIVAIDGERGVDQQKLRRVLSGKRPGDDLELTILRRGEESRLAVKLGASRNTLLDTWRGAYDGKWLNDYYRLQWTPKADAFSPTDGWVRMGDELFHYVDRAKRGGEAARDPLRTEASPAPAADTLADIARRLTQIEQALEGLQKKASGDSGR